MSAADRVRLSLVLDGVAALRQRRLASGPDPVAVALVAQQAGADGVTMRLRTDRAEIQDRDVDLVAQLLHTVLNLRIGVEDSLIASAIRFRPARCCLVPEQRHDHASGGGLDAARLHGRLGEARQRLYDADIEVAARIDPELDQIDACARARLDAVELNCGAYALATSRDAVEKRLAALGAAARHAADAGLGVYAGGGLDYRNVTPVIAAAKIAELRIGHAILADALIHGVAASLGRMLALVAARHVGA